MAPVNTVISPLSFFPSAKRLKVPLIDVFHYFVELPIKDFRLGWDLLVDALSELGKAAKEPRELRKVTVSLFSVMIVVRQLIFWRRNSRFAALLDTN